MDVSFQATTNWTLVAGVDLANAIQTKPSTTEDFIKPQLDDIISAEHAVLLNSGTFSNKPTCDLTIRLFPKYKIESLTIVCTSPKIELFTGIQCEYVETVYGERLEDEEASTDDTDGFRYDIEIHKSGVTHLMLKLITPSNELCLYGIHLNVAPNPDGITTLLPSKINLDNVKELLNNSSQKLSPSAEKCKMFLETYKNAMNSGGGGLIEELKKGIKLQTELETTTYDVTPPILCDNSSQVLTNYINEKIKESESRILKRLDALEESQNIKLDRILRLLEQKTIVTNDKD